MIRPSRLPSGMRGFGFHTWRVKRYVARTEASNEFRYYRVECPRRLHFAACLGPTFARKYPTGLGVGFQARSRNTRLGLDRDLFGDLDAVSIQADDLAGVVGEQADGVQTEIGENLRAQAAFMLGLLLAVGCAIGHVVAESWAGLVQVDQNTC